MNNHMTYQLKNDEKHVVDNEGPFPAVAIGRDTEQAGADRTEHEHEGDAPGDVRVVLAESLCKLANGQRDGEEIKRVPGLRMC